MPKPQERDLDQTKIIFRSWLETQLDGATDLNVKLLGGPENTGFSNETLSFNVSYELKGAKINTGMVLRFYPEGFFVFPDYDIHKLTPPSKIDRNAKLNIIDAVLAPSAFRIAASYLRAFSVDAAVPTKTKNPVKIVVVAPYKTTEEIEERILET